MQTLAHFRDLGGLVLHMFIVFHRLEMLRMVRIRFTSVVYVVFVKYVKHVISSQIGDAMRFNSVDMLTFKDSADCKTQGPMLTLAHVRHFGRPQRSNILNTFHVSDRITVSIGSNTFDISNIVYTKPL